MNQNYPNHILIILREAHGLDCDDSSRDEEFQTMFPESVFEAVLEYEGIIGYVYCILNWIESIYKVKLNPHGDEQPLEEFRQGLCNILEARGLDDNAIETMATAICEDIELNV